MDQLHKLDDNSNKLFDYLLLENAFKIWSGDSGYKVSVYFGRFTLGDKCVSDGFTFTQLKNNVFGKEHFEKNKTDLVITEFIYNALDYLLSLDDDIDEFFFEIPIRIKAQNKYDRPSFGETSDYAIYGVKFSHFFTM